MKFLETDNVCVKQRRAKLVLDLYDLLHQTRGTSGVATMAQWCDVRGLSNAAAARRDLYRRAHELAALKVTLAFGVDEDGFGIDLHGRGLRALVSREVNEATVFLQQRKKLAGAAALSHDDDINVSGTCLNCGSTSRVPLEELMTQRSRETFVTPMRELRRDYHVGHARLKRILQAAGRERKQGGQPVETLRPKDDVVKAVHVARAKGAFKVKVAEIAELLDCSPRTAARFIRRVRGGPASSSR